MSQELDLFNLKYQRLCESLRSRIEEVGDKHKDDPEIQVGYFTYGYTLLFQPSKYRVGKKFTEF